MAAIDDDADHVAASISAMSLDGAALCIVKGVGSVRDVDMPFVNRHEELWQLFRVNADICHRIATSTEESMSNFRLLDLLFCVQYFGAGKTTLGKEFPEKVKDNDVKETFASKFGDDDGLKSEWNIIQERGIRRVFIDVRKHPNILQTAANEINRASGIMYDFTSVTVGPHIPTSSAEHAADYLIQFATDNGPTLFHFDEVGAKEEHNLNHLRELAVAVWTQMHAICRKRGAGAMPRVYFLITGKSIEPFADVGSGSSGMGSYFLVLDMLAVEHVHRLRRHLQDSDKVDNPLCLVGLDEERDGGYLNERLARATGGAPRLLLYTLRALHFSKASLTSTNEIDTAVMETVFSLLYGIAVVSSEFLPTSSSRQAFHLLLAFSMQRTKLTLDTEVELDGKDTMLGQILRFQPFFLSRDDCADGQFVLHLPLYHLQAAKMKFGSDAVSMVLISMAGGTISANEAWRVFELLPAHVMASQAAMNKLLLPTPDKTSWADALPSLLAKSEIAKKAKFDLGAQPFSIIQEAGICPDVIEQDPEKYAAMDSCVFPPDKSKSADLFHVQRRLDSRGVVLFEWQAKFFFAGGLTMSTIRDEVDKSAKKLDSVLIVYSANVGPQLRGAMTDQVLILPSWSQKNAAEFAFSSSGLFWRSAGSKKQAWCEFPMKVAAKEKHAPAAGASVVKVRAGLEVVIPHHDLVEKLLGGEMFDSLVKLQKDKNNPTTISSVITTLDSVLSGSLGSGKGKAATSADEVKLKDAKKERDKAEDKRDKAEDKLDKAKKELKDEKKELKDATASGDEKAIERADRAYALAEEGVTSAQKGVTSAQDMVTYLTKVFTAE
jgi:hypothetical protein